MPTIINSAPSQIPASAANQNGVTIATITWLGTSAAVVLALSSFGAGAVRNRGGVLKTLDLEFLSYGHGAGLSNALFWLGLALIVACWVLLGRKVVDKQADLTAVNGALLSWVMPLLFAAPMLSRDVYSYLMQGAMLRDGFDPYSQGAAVNPGPMLLEVSHDWRNTTTPYGPLHLWIGDVITSIVGDNITLGIVLYKLVSFAGFAMIAWSVPKIAREMGSDQAFAQWLCVANPVMIFHLIGGMHNESIMVGLVSLGVLAALKGRFVLAVCAVAVSISLKATAVFALPFIVWMGLRAWHGRTATERNVRAFGRFVLTGAWMSALSLTVVSAITWLSGASWGWVSQISGNSKVINPLALPSLIASLITPIGKLFDDDFAYNEVLAITRPLSQLLMLLGLVTVWWLFRRTKQQAVTGIVAAYLVAVIFNAVTLPWYYTSLINFIGTLRLPPAVLKLSVILSIIVAGSFTGSGNHQLYNIGWMLILAAVAWVLTRFIFANNPQFTTTAQHDSAG
ncbi:alpha-(1-_6)-mannopyranosyltransferase A [Corynebacterium epidermidicanis]|uniref:Alpha-(1->6)-mannopyranosyltransferase A n=1 Tax=Corynebacterium epidermidicanis TaxID=1050174 RepID=A0A0G3GQQ6_9CORY|nr:alpha-(1->6)-mannopyranosyltransferase A [Corynebacterium epidermidicanis]AKK03536.1 carotene biosynthesis associated membrane protein [Corynebacterium epidermidicanis]